MANSKNDINITNGVFIVYRNTERGRRERNDLKKYLNGIGVTNYCLTLVKREEERRYLEDSDAGIWIGTTLYTIKRINQIGDVDEQGKKQLRGVITQQSKRKSLDGAVQA